MRIASRKLPVCYRIGSCARFVTFLLSMTCLSNLPLIVTNYCCSFLFVTSSTTAQFNLLPNSNPASAYHSFSSTHLYARGRGELTSENSVSKTTRLLSHWIMCAVCHIFVIHDLLIKSAPHCHQLLLFLFVCDLIDNGPIQPATKFQSCFSLPFLQLGDFRLIQLGPL